MDPTTLLLEGVLAPAVLAGLLLALGWRAWRREAPGDARRREAPGVDGRWIGGPALAFGFGLTFYFLSGWPASPLPDSPRTPTGLDWLAWLCLPVGLLLALEGRLGRRRHLLRGLVAVVALRLVLTNAFANIWEPGEGWLWLAGLTILLLLQWAALARATRRPGASGPLLLWILATGLAVLAGLTGSARIGQLSGGLAAGLGAALVLAWWRPRLALEGSGAGLVIVLLFGLGLNAYFFSYTEGLDVALLAAAPFAALVAELPPLKRLAPSKRTAAQAVCALLPIAVALMRAGMAFVAAQEEAGDYY